MKTLVSQMLHIVVIENVIYLYNLSFLFLLSCQTCFSISFILFLFSILTPTINVYTSPQSLNMFVNVTLRQQMKINPRLIPEPCVYMDEFSCVFTDIYLIYKQSIPPGHPSCFIPTFTFSHHCFDHYRINITCMCLL